MSRRDEEQEDHPAFRPGECVVVESDDPYRAMPPFRATVRWRTGCTCGEHGRPIYRLAFVLENSRPVEGDFCSATMNKVH